MLLDTHVAYARRGAFANEAEQARPARAFRPVVHALGTRAHGKDSQQKVESFANGPHVCVRSKGTIRFVALFARDHRARHLITHRHDEERVRLVIAELHVEARVKFLDPGVFERECLDIARDDRPLHLACGGHHFLRARVEVREILKIVPKPLAKILRLAHVDDPRIGVEEPVDARIRRNRPRRRPVRRRIRHYRSSRRNCPVNDSSTFATSSGVPVAITRPPPLPPSGPRSMR